MRAHAVILVAVLLAGCAGRPNIDLAPVAARGDYAVAREVLADRITRSRDRSDRDYVLDRVRLGMVELADGQADAAETPLLAAYDLLRVQGLNDDRTTRAFLGTERDAITWKGEPFEQAAAYAYLAAQLASVSDWGNTRAAAQQSLFLLADFGAGPDGRERTFEELYDDLDSSGDFDGALDTGYQPIETNFAPGYFMAGLGDWGRRRLDPGFRDAALDNFRKAVRYAPALEPTVDAVTSGRANTVFWVDFGAGPAKVRTGPDGAISRYVARSRSDDGALMVSVNGSSARSYGVSADFNNYARDHRWRAREELRLAKSALGDVMLQSGAIFAASSDGDEGRAIAGVALVLAGLITKANAGADIRHNELLPQRSYFVAADIRAGDSMVELQIGGRPGSRLVLTALDPPDDPGDIQFRYVRLNDTPAPASWATSGEVYYANDAYEGRVRGDGLPYIMGGTCVRTPTPGTLARYKDAGNLRDFTTNDLRNLYRDEGITFEIGEQGGLGVRHILEGGSSLVSPQEGTAGYARVFGRVHPAYTPRSDGLRRAIAEHITLEEPR